MKAALLVFPHQLFLNHPGLAENIDQVLLCEDPLFFGDLQYPCYFHRQKLTLHRATMRRYFDDLLSHNHDVRYCQYAGNDSQLPHVFNQLKSDNIGHIYICDVVDNILEKRLNKYCKDINIDIEWLPTPGFLNSRDENEAYRRDKKRWFMGDFYKWQRRRLNILMQGNEPIGGKWSFDEDNRKKIPKKDIAVLPQVTDANDNVYTREAKQYVAQNFPDALGCDARFFYPIDHAGAKKWLQNFLEQRFDKFGRYEDAIVEDHNYLYHSILTPMLNIGLLTPQYVIDMALKYAQDHGIMLASVEGFIRQIIGWREFMRATYDDLGVSMRTTNHWAHYNPMPKSFYDGSTDILPIDNCIKRILETGYCHHIERLMVLGGFMFLCEIDPDEIYKWFMEMFADSYDWVMVPNVYAMSQNADGGQITTKPYFSGSNYIRKMSHYKQAEWSEVWDALYWRWVLKQADGLRKNPRWSMMVRMAENMEDEKKQNHLRIAESFLEKLHNKH